jgi:hypothetical protein
VLAGAEWGAELYRIAAAQFEHTVDVLDLDPEFRTRLLQPRRSLVVNFPSGWTTAPSGPSRGTASSTR